MISRYDKKEMSTLWTDEYKFTCFLKAELALMKAWEIKGLFPKGSVEKIENNLKIKTQRIYEIEAETKHDVIAFCSSITEQMPPEISKFFHFGVTSSDIIDTALSLQLKESLNLILPSLKEVCQTLLLKSKEYKDILCMGRSHGMYAEPMSFGQKWLSFYAECSRRLQDLQHFYDNELTAQFSGAVGNYTLVTPEVEEIAAKGLGLALEPVSTQVIPRDRLAKLTSIHALIGCAIERISVEIRHLHRSELQELHEGFSKGQKGSSIMPHKKNPISGENLTGMARLLRSHVSLSMENIPLWHERDISHSSAERMYLPDNFGILYYALKRLNSTLENLVVHKETIEKRVHETSIYLSSFYLHELIEKTELTREEIYPLIQQVAFDKTNLISLENFSVALKKILEEKNIKVDISTFKQGDLKKVYLKNFEETLKRCENSPF
jgi:adenylosuccinate lyase